MSLKSYVWVLLGSVAVLELGLIQSNYNDLLPNRAADSLEINPHDGLSTFFVVAPAVVVVAAFVLSALRGWSDIIVAGLVGTFLFGALFDGILPNLQAHNWTRGIVIGMICLIPSELHRRRALLRKQTAPDAAPARAH